MIPEVDCGKHCMRLSSLWDRIFDKFTSFERRRENWNCQDGKSGVYHIFLVKFTAFVAEDAV